MKKYKVITLCGSTRFEEDFLREQLRLSLAGNVVFSVNFLSKSDALALTHEQRKILGEVHKRKIDLSDEIFVINKGGYIGESTRSEIEYATKRSKKVVYLEPIN